MSRFIVGGSTRTEKALILARDRMYSISAGARSFATKVRKNVKSVLQVIIKILIAVYTLLVILIILFLNLV